MTDQQQLEFRKTSYSNGSGGNNCVEVAGLPDGSRVVRDSKDPGGPTLRFSAGEWAAFMRGAKDGEFD